ncbi:CDP-alcohol phosphatidyltransferase family protein [Undibacter mobilis]|uniref:Phosphatidylcholine synthase n=1 Tax=Undibacter mobilis TaxID=2292256 RepID=A0A371B122_9BRAD|nr:CDP-alcohol phosphatidyltransferase family protein [Undibacter mobilis]RDV01161.1 phosphatidylcholine synthase [Undibacter mobilis]
MDFRHIGAFAIHVLTASGAALALVALILATGGHWTAMFACLGVALIVDGIDGPLARALRVKDVLPRWDGAGLDFVVDFTTYVFVPAYAITASGLLPDGLGVPAAVVIVVTGALYFADRTMKTDDNYFRGFPAVWNVIAFYLYVLMPPPWIAAVTIAALAALTFVPVRFVHPLRVKHLRWLNVALMVVWAALALVTLIANLAPGLPVVAGLSVIALYFLGAGLLRRAN